MIISSLSLSHQYQTKDKPRPHSYTLKHTFLAVWPDPALHALLIAELIALVMAKVIITRATLFVALVAVVMSVAAHAHAVLEAGSATLVLNELSFLSGVHFPTGYTSLDQQFIICDGKERNISSCVHTHENTHTVDYEACLFSCFGGTRSFSDCLGASEEIIQSGTYQEVPLPPQKNTNTPEFPLEKRNAVTLLTTSVTM